jgi:cation/acetate symporter
LVERQPPGPQETHSFARALRRRYLYFTIGLAAFLGVMALLERAAMPRSMIGAGFLIGTVVVYAAIGLLCRTTDEAEYYVAGRRVPAIYNGMATAADWMSAASFIGTAGVLYLQGFAGLAYIVGWTGGYCLVALLLAPYLRRFGQYTIPDFLGARYGGTAPRLIGAAAAIGVSFVYVVVQVYGVGLITSHLTGFNFEIGIFVGLGGVLVCSFLGGMRAVTWTQVAQYIIVIVAYLVPVIWLGFQQTGSLAPWLSYGQQLAVVSQREAELIADPREQAVSRLLARRADDAEHKLADVPAAMAADNERVTAKVERLRGDNAPLADIQRAEHELSRLPRYAADAEAVYRRERDDARSRARPLAGLAPQAQPFATASSSRDGALSTRPTRGETGAQAAAQPGLYGGSDTSSSGERTAASARELSRRNFLALVFCLMFGTAAMPHVLARYYTTPSVADTRNSVAWSLFFIVLLYICVPALAVMVKYEVFTHLVGTPFTSLPLWIRRWSRLDPTLASAEDVNGDGILQLGELHLGGDLIVLAAPEIGGLPLVVSYLVAAGGLAAALSTADGLLLTISNALSHDLYYRVVSPKTSAVRRVMLSKMTVLLVALAAAWVASLRIAAIVPFVTAAFSIAAASLFPALVLGIFWRRATHSGAVTAMLAGMAVCIGYMAINLHGMREMLGFHGPVADTLWWGIDPFSAGVFGVPVGLATLVVVSLLTRPPTAQQLDLVRLLRSAEPPRHG